MVVQLVQLMQEERTERTERTEQPELELPALAPPAVQWGRLAGPEPVEYPSSQVRPVVVVELPGWSLIAERAHQESDLDLCAASALLTRGRLGPSLSELLPPAAELQGNASASAVYSAVVLQAVRRSAVQVALA